MVYLRNIDFNLLLYPCSIAAMAGAAGEYLGDPTALSTGTLTAVYLATFIGGMCSQ